MAATTTCRQNARLGPAGFVRQVVFLAAALALYLATRLLTVGSVADAEQNALDLLAAERFLGIDIEAAAQGLIIERPVLVTFFNWVYVWGHWPVLGVVAVWLFANHRATFFRYRNALVLSGLFGLVVFALYPVAPPRLLDIGMVDTVHDLSTSYQILQPPSLVNQYAAMPSFHVGWNVLVTLAVFHATRNVELRGAAAFGSALMLMSVVLTANHYLVDAVAGVAIVSVAWVVGGRWVDRSIQPECDDRYTESRDFRTSSAQSSAHR